MIFYEVNKTIQIPLIDEAKPHKQQYKELKFHFHNGTHEDKCYRFDYPDFEYSNLLNFYHSQDGETIQFGLLKDSKNILFKTYGDEQQYRSIVIGFADFSVIVHCNSTRVDIVKGDFNKTIIETIYTWDDGK